MKFNGNTPPYQLNKFVYAFKLNQRVKAASLVSDEPIYNLKKDKVLKKLQSPLILENNKPIKIYCSEPILAIKKRKVWLKQFLYVYKSEVPCVSCRFFGIMFLFIE
jgi:hypothetical protein